MQVTIEETGALERLMTVQVPADEIESKARERFQHLSRTVRLKGFRPGKVPLNVVKQRYGRQVMDEVTQEVMQNSLRDAIEQESLKVAALPALTPAPLAEQSEQFQFTARLELYPEIGQLELRDITVQRPVAEIGDEDVDEMLKTLQEQRRTWTEPDRGAIEGDRVMANFVATLEDGQKIPADKRQKIATVIGSGVAPADIEAGLNGMKAGENKEFSAGFPEDYGDELLAGKTVTLDLQVEKVQEGQLPLLDDEFASSFGVDGGVEQLRSDVRENLERELAQARSQVLRRRFVNALVGHFSDLELPPSLLRREAELLRQNIGQQVEQAGGDVNQVPSLEDLAAPARQRVLAGYLFGELAERNNIDLDQGRVRSTIERLAATYDQPEQVVEYYYQERQLLQQVQQQVMEEQIVEWALDQISVNDESMAFGQLVKEARNV